MRAGQPFWRRSTKSPRLRQPISRLIAQLRYRWEIAPLSDLFVVYTRGANLANAYDLDDPFATPRDSFGQLYGDALSDPLVDLLVVKLRYRFGR